MDLNAAEAVAAFRSLTELDTPVASLTSQARHIRIHQIRSAIEAGEYRVPASELAAALVSFSRRAN